MIHIVDKAERRNFMEQQSGFLDRIFHLKENHTSVRTEIMAGITTFMTMAYILAVNPGIMSAAGMDKGALLTATALAAFIGTILMALFANYPFALAPGMGLNAFFAFTVVGQMGYSWQTALAAVCLEGVIFIILSLTNVREAIFNAIPINLKRAVSAGIGLFIAFIGLKNAGIIVKNEGTFVGLGAFTAPCLLGIFATLLSGILMARKVKGALFWGIIVATIVGIPMGVTMFPDHWLPVSAPQDISPIFCKFDFSGLLNLKTVLVVFSLLIVNIFDTIGTLMGLAEKTGIVREDGSIPRVSEAMMSDAIGTTCGAMLGSSTISTYIESASGIAEGGRSGVTSLVVGGMFLLSLFLSPIFLLIPSAATSGALIMVGVLMLDSVKKINLQDMTEAFPAFITMITMVLCYSIADGICLGILSFAIMKLCTGRWKDLNWTLCILSLLFIINFAFG